MQVESELLKLGYSAAPNYFCKICQKEENKGIWVQFVDYAAVWGVKFYRKYQYFWLHLKS